MGSTKLSFTGLLVVTLALGGPVALAEPWQIPAPPEVNVAHCKVSPVVDGELKEACWQSAKPIGDFYLWRGDGEQRQVQAVKVVHDGTWLYAAYEIERPHSDVIESTVADHDGNVSADDSVELFQLSRFRLAENLLGDLPRPSFCREVPDDDNERPEQSPRAEYREVVGS